MMSRSKITIVAHTELISVCVFRCVVMEWTAPESEFVYVFFAILFRLVVRLLLSSRFVLLVNGPSMTVLDQTTQLSSVNGCLFSRCLLSAFSFQCNVDGKVFIAYLHVR
jgi:hypothetical protein